VFDEDNTEWAQLRADVRQRLDDRAWEAARRTTLNAHYSPAEVVEQVWATVGALGFAGGRVLEPGCGSGNFIGLAPAGLDLDVVGIELDPTTARIASALYPHADIRAEGFERSRLPRDSFDLVVGNVPFAKVVLHEPAHNSARLSLHNHFIVKSLDLTHPGGIVAVVTSRFTLDARNPAARREIADRADLLGALRLPAGALRAAAGTDAVSDLVILRRREAGRTARAESWERSVLLGVDGGEIPINEYFVRHRERVLGQLVAGGGQYSQVDLQVRADPDRPLAPALAEALVAIVADARAEGLVWAARTSAGAPARARPVAADVMQPHHKEGSILSTGTGGFARVVDGAPQPYPVAPRKDAGELRALVGMRDSLAQLLDLEVSTVDDVDADVVRAELNRRYEAYQARYGTLNRFSLVRTGRQDPDTGGDLYRRSFPSMGGFRADPDYHSVLALEVFDAETQTARKAPILQGRVLAPRQPRHGADSAQDALAICLDEHGRADIDVIAGLLGTDAGAARAELGELVWDDPATAELVPAPRYLSGDVRAKLAVAEAAASEDLRWQANVEALRRVVPVDLGPAEIDARLGSSWIPPADVRDFLVEVLDCTRPIVEYVPVTATWALTVPTGDRQSVAVRSEWGTARADAVSLVTSALNQTPATVYDSLDDGRRVLNPAETIAAREKQEALGERFAAWVWENPARRDRLTETYNRLFNGTVLPSYDGSHLSLPGLAASFIPHRHQRDAVWRMVSEPTVLLAHDVGAGKTATMAMGAMELRRLGLVKKPGFVVPNHMLEQFSRELAQLYPRAKLLVASRDDASAAGRKSFVARCATGDWDAVVMTASAFARLPVSDDTRGDFIAERIAELRGAIAASKEGLSVKRLEERVARLEQKHEALLATERRDDGVTFEQTGIDYLLVDEAHGWKNRPLASRIAGVGGAGSQKAEDLEMKLGYVRSRYGNRVTTFATATPIANSLSEMWVMQSYLQPERLAAAGVATFDAWAATFGRTVTALELSPDGGSYRINTRFARFANVPELLTMFRATADVRGAAQLALDVPALAGGAPKTVVVPASTELQAYVAELVERAEQVRQRRVTPSEDNMLKVSGDGRKAALDLRLVGREPDPEGGKIAAAAAAIAERYHAEKTATYADRAGQPSPRPGSLQIVFCDLGTPHPGQWSVYAELRDELVRRGVPEAEVRFVHEAADDKAKAELFAGCRDGRVAVLIGSTEKMGVGTNVQARLSALHHLDCPWRPADIAQREGRAIRQGNQNPQVAITRYVTEGSFDVFCWQTVERKAAFIHQVMSGDVPGREIDDVGDTALSYAEVKALATGNPLILEKAGVDNELARLLRLRQAHDRDQTGLSRTLAGCDSTATRLEGEIATLEVAIDARRGTGGESFAMTVDGTRHTKRPDAGGHLKAVLAQELHRQQRQERPSPARVVGELGGLALELTTRRDFGGTAEARVRIGATPVHLRLIGADLGSTDALGLVSRLEKRVRGLDVALETARADLSRTNREAAAARARLGAPFPHEERLAKLRARQAEIGAALLPEASPPAETVPTTASDRPAIGRQSRAEMLLAELARRARPVAFQDSPASLLAGRRLPDLVDELERVRTAVARRAVAERRAMAARRDVAAAELAMREASCPTGRSERRISRRARAGPPGPNDVADAQRRLAQARANADEAAAALAEASAPAAGIVGTLEQAIELRDLQVEADTLRNPPTWLRTDVARRVATHSSGDDELDSARLALAYGRTATYAERCGLSDAERIEDILAADPPSDALIRHRIAVIDDLGPGVGADIETGPELGR
jgi:N12 class adenine-specific DNA methylase/SAM-dependent methyltransferase